MFLLDRLSLYTNQQTNVVLLYEKQGNYSYIFFIIKLTSCIVCWKYRY